MTSNSEKPTILVVDDDPDQLEILSTLLECDSYNVISVMSAVAGLRVLEMRKVSAVVSDISMPGMSGIEFINQLRHRLGEQTPAVVMVTAGVRHIHSAESGFRADAFFMKQNLKSTLLPGLRDLIAQRSATQSVPL